MGELRDKSREGRESRRMERENSRDMSMERSHESSERSRESSTEREPRNKEPLPRNKTKRVKPNAERDNQMAQFHDKIADLFICNVCLANPTKDVYQCHYGHLMCIGCFGRLLADARIKDEQARCPKCRVDISRNSCSRNLAVERVVCELLSGCTFCSLTLPRNRQDSHQKECPERPVWCDYKRVGCTWEGPAHSLSTHLSVCALPATQCKEAMTSILKSDKKVEDELQNFRAVVQFMSQEKLMFTDVVLSPHRTDDFLPQLYYESSKFTLFGQFWQLRGRVLGDEHNFQRSFNAKLIMKGKGSFDVKYCIMRDSDSNIDVVPVVHRHAFVPEEQESEYHEVQLAKPLDVNNLLAERTIKFRLYLAQVHSLS